MQESCRRAKCRESTRDNGLFSILVRPRWEQRESNSLSGKNLRREFRRRGRSQRESQMTEITQRFLELASESEADNPNAATNVSRPRHRRRRSLSRGGLPAMRPWMRRLGHG